MVVHQDQGRGGQFERPPDDFPRIDGRVVHRAVGDQFVAQEVIAAVEKEGSELFPGQMGQGRPGIGCCAN